MYKMTTRFGSNSVTFESPDGDPPGIFRTVLIGRRSYFALTAIFYTSASENELSTIFPTYHADAWEFIQDFDNSEHRKPLLFTSPMTRLGSVEGIWLVPERHSEVFLAWHRDYLVYDLDEFRFTKVVLSEYDLSDLKGLKRPIEAAPVLEKHLGVKLRTWGRSRAREAMTAPKQDQVVVSGALGA